MNKKPIIGVIGATAPQNDYNRNQGIKVGYKLREAINSAGTIFTGGVNGVGVDVYIGVMKFCVDHGNLDDKFFVLIPQFLTIRGTQEQISYDTPEAYHVLAALTTKGHLEIVYAGDSMDERREKTY